MERDQIIQWAREAGAAFDMNGENHCFETKDSLVDFAKLVAAHEREACAQACERIAKNPMVNRTASVCAIALRAKGN